MSLGQNGEPGGPNDKDPDGEEPVTQVVDAADVVEEADLEEVSEEPTSAPAPRPPAPPPERLRSPPVPIDSVRMGIPLELRDNVPPAVVPTPAPARVPDDEAPPPPDAVVPPTDPRALENVEELSGGDLIADDEPVRDGVIDAAIAGAKKAIAEGGGPVRIQFYETELAALTPDDKAQRALYEHEIGELTEAAGDESAAVKAYAKALQSDATLKPNLWAIRRVFQRRALWPNLLKLLDAEIRFARSDAEKAELWVEKGNLYEDKLNQAAEAEDCYNKAAVAWPAAIAAWLALEKIFARKGDLAGLARVMRGQAAATAEPARRAALLLDLARLQDSVDGGSVDAALELCREAYQTGADPERSLDELQKIARRAGRTDDVLWGLEARALLLGQLAEAAGPAERPALIDRVIGVRRQQAREAVGLADDGPARAWEYLSRAFEARPEEPLILRDLTDAAESLGRWEDLANLLQRRIEAAPVELRASLMLQRADALRRAGRAQDADAAEAEIQRDLPQHLGLQISRERDALANRDWGRLASLYLHEAEQALAGRTPTGQPDAQWAAIAFTQAGTLLGDRAGRDAEALAALEKAREAASDYLPAIDALERLYARTGKWAEYAALIEAELGRSPSESRTRRLYERLVGVRELGLDDPAGAALAMRRLAELRPDEVRLKLRVVELHRAAGKWIDVADDLKVLAGALEGERKLEAVLERAEVLERRLGDDVAAQKAFKEALSIKPGEPRAADGFERISRRRSGHISGPHEKPVQGDVAWDDLAQALKREADATLDPEHATQVLLKLAEVHERERAAPADAAQTYQELLDKAPGNSAALRGLQRVHALAGDEEKRAQALELEVDSVTSDASKLELLTLLGELAEDALKDDERADDAYRRALNEVTAPHPAMGRFRVAVRKRDAKAISETMSLLEALLGEAPDGARAGLLDERVWAERAAGDLENAVALTRETLQQSNGVTQSPRLQRARLSAKAGGATELGDSLEALAANATDPALQAVLLRRAGQLALGAGTEDVARARIEKGRALLPSDPDLVIALADLHSDADVLQARIALAEGAAQVEWILERGEALEAQGKLAEAAREVTRALTIDPQHLPALEILRRLARTGGDDVGYARASAQLAAEVQDQERSAAIYNQAGDAFERAHLREEAAAAFRAALDRTPLDGSAFNRARALLGAIYAEKKAPGALVELFTHRLLHLGDDQHREDRAQLHLDRAQLYADEGDRDAAEKDLRAVLRDYPDHLGGMRRLAEILAVQAHGRAEAVQLLERYLELETATEHRRATLLRLAELEESPGGRPERAVEQLQAAIELAPKPEASLPDRDRLAQLHLRLRSWQRAIQTLQKMVDLQSDPALKARYEMRIAQIYKDGFSDPRAAVEALVRALRHAPLELDALATLVGFFEQGHVVQLDLDDKLERALDAARQKAGREPAKPDAYQALTRIHGWRADEDARLIAAQALALSRREKPSERDDVIDPVKELAPAAWERLQSDEARSVGLEVWRLGSEASMKVYGPQLEQLHVGKAERVSGKQLPPGWAHLDKIARALGVAGYELYQSKEREGCAVGANGDTPVVAAGGAFAERLAPRLRFRLARKLALLRDRLGPLELVDDEELNLFFAAVARVAELPRPASVKASDAKLEERAKAVNKAMGRKERKAIGALGGRFAGLPAPVEWKRAVLDGAARAALVIGGDLAAALAELGLSFGDPAANALTQFALSDEYATLRRELGLKP
jgi:tetratricopeptide (TPR) repeat protein